MPPKGSTSNRAKKRPDDQAQASLGPLSTFYAAEAPAASRKRAPSDRIPIERVVPQPAAKRRKVDDVGSVNGRNAGDAGGPKELKWQQEQKDMRAQQVLNFSTLPAAMVSAYLTKFELVPPIRPSPLSTSNPPLPSYLVNPPANARPPTPPPVTSMTPANRPRRDAGNANRRRSTRLAEEEAGWKDMRPPILPDLADSEKALAMVAQRHFEKQSVRETDVVTAFVYAVKTKDRTLKILPQ